MGCLVGVHATSQSQDTSPTEVNLKGQRIEEVKPLLEQQFRHYEVYELDRDLSTPDNLPDGTAMHVHLNLSESMHWDLELVPNYLFASDALIQAATKDGNKRLEKPECTTFMGSPASGAKSSVRLNVSEHGFWGILPKPDAPGESFYIEPLRNFDEQAPAHQYIVYAPEDVLETANMVCVHKHVEHTRQTVVDHGVTGRSGGSTDCFGVEMAVAVDYSAYYYDDESSPDVINRYTGVLNVADGYYDVFDIDFIINDFFIVESPEENPWTTSGNAYILLEEFQIWANNHFGYYDVASLWTYRSLRNNNGNTLGGLAQGNPCDEKRGRNVMKVGSYISDLELAPLWSHETGHNLDAIHDPVGAPYIMKESGTLVDITDFSAQSQQDINDYIHNHDCVSCIAPDLIPVLASEDEGLTVAWGSQYTLTPTTRNIGVLTAGGSVMRCYWSDDDQWDSGDAYLGQSSFPSLDRDTQVGQKLTIQIPTGGHSDLKYIIYVADATGLVDERSEEDNNVLAIPVILTDPTNPYDFQVSIDQQSIPASIKPGSAAFQTPVVVSLSGLHVQTLQNLTFYQVKLFLSRKETIGPGSLELGSMSINNLQPISMQIISMNTFIQGNVPYGQYYLIAQVDVQDDVTENNEYNNEFVVPILVTAPDLVMEDVDAILPGPKSSQCHVSGKVANQNTLPAGASSLGITMMIKVIGGTSAMEVHVGNYPVPAIPAENFHAFSHSFPYTPPANYEIIGVKFTADILDVVTEENEGNNVGKYLVDEIRRRSFTVAETAGVRLYPNPASDQVMLRFEQADWASEEAELMILNNSGQQMQVLNIPGNTFSVDLDVSDFPAGTYQIVIRQHDRLIYREMLLKL